MHDAPTVERVEAGPDVCDEPDEGVDRQWTLLRQTRLERPSPHEGHREVRASVGLPRVDDRDEMPVLDLARRPRLVHESLPEDVVVVELGAKDLERDLLAVGLAHGAEDDAHASLAEGLLDPVGTEAVAGPEVRHGAEDRRRAGQCDRCHLASVPHHTARAQGSAYGAGKEVGRMMGSDMVAKERIAQLMREAQADRLSKPIAEARRAARHERVSNRLSAIGAIFARRRREVVRPAQVEPVR